MKIQEGKLGVAFLRGISMFGKHNYSQEQIRKILTKLEKRHPNVRFLAIYDNDTVVFVKKGVHYATVGDWMERELERELGERIWVTTRSLEKLKRVLARF